MTEPAGSDWPKATYAWWLVVILASANMVSYMDRTILSLLVGPIEKTLGITDTQMGLLQGTAFALFYSIIILPLGFVADRTNRTRLLAAGVALWSLMTATCGLATSFGMLFLTRMGVGIGEATLAPTAPSIISDLLPVERRPPALGLYTVGSATGGGLALLLGGAITEIVVTHPTIRLPLFGALASWQVVCMAVGLPGLLVSFLLLVTGEPKRRGYTAQGASPQELKQFFKRTWPVILPHFGGFTLLYTYTFGAGAWWPTLFTRTHGWTIGQVGFRYGLAFLIFGPLGAVAGGMLARVLRKRGGRSACLLTTALAILALIVPSVIAPLIGDDMVALIVLCPALFLTAAIAPPSISAVQEITPNALRGQVTALYFFVMGLVGIMTGPVLIGFLNDKVFPGITGIGLSLASFCIALCLPAGLLILYAAFQRRKHIATIPEYA